MVCGSLPLLDDVREDEKALTLPTLAAPQPSCPEWCSSQHNPGDLEAGDFLCSHSTLEDNGLAVGVQRGARLDAGNIVYDPPDVFVIGLAPGTMTPQTAGPLARALSTATAYAVWRTEARREPPFPTVPAGW